MCHDERCNFLNGLHWHKYLYLESKLVKVSRYILIDTDNFQTYSEELADLLVLLGNEVDTFFREMVNCPNIISYIACTDLKIKKILNIDDFKLIFEPFYELSHNLVEVQHGLGNEFSLIPFSNFKEETPTWWTAYNKIKHEHYDNLHKANLENVLNCLAGLFVLNALHKCSKEFLLLNEIIEYPKYERIMYDRLVEIDSGIERALIDSNIGTTSSASDLCIRTELFDFKYRIEEESD